MDTKIDPAMPPVSADDLASEALAAGITPDAPPLIDAGEPGDASAEEGSPDVAIPPN